MLLVGIDEVGILRAISTLGHGWKKSSTRRKDWTLHYSDLALAISLMLLFVLPIVIQSEYCIDFYFLCFVDFSLCLYARKKSEMRRSHLWQLWELCIIFELAWMVLEGCETKHMFLWNWPKLSASEKSIDCCEWRSPLLKRFRLKVFFGCVAPGFNSKQTPQTSSVHLLEIR